MDNKKRKSILQTQGNKEDGNPESRPKRVSFYNKKSVREFNFEEGGWEGDYELSTNNSSLKSNSTSSQTKINASTTLCTTSEYINKSDHGTICIENSLDFTLLDSEKNLQRSSKTKQPLEKTNILEKTEKSTTLKYKEDNEKENDGKFIFFNENSNKENIEPQQIDIPTYTDCDVTLKGQHIFSSDSEESFAIRSFQHDLQRINERVEQKVESKIPTYIDAGNQKVAHEKGEDNELHEKILSITKPSKVFVRHITTPLKLVQKVQDSNHKKSQEQQRQNLQQEEIPHQKDKRKSSLNFDILSDVSGISPIPVSPASNSYRMSTSPSSNNTSLLPPEYLASNQKKKINLQQLNADMAKGKVKLFPNSAIRTIFQTKYATPLKSVNKTKKDFVDIELENTFWKTKQNSKENEEMIEDVNIFEQNPRKSRETIFYDEEILDQHKENEVTKQKEHFVSRSLFKSDDLDLSETLNPAKTLDHNVKENSKNEFNITIPMEEAINPEIVNQNKPVLRRTIFFENENIESYTKPQLKTALEMEIQTDSDSDGLDIDNEDDDNLYKAIQRDENKTILFQNQKIINSTDEILNVADKLDDHLRTSFQKSRRGTLHFNQTISIEDKIEAANSKSMELDFLNNQELDLSGLGKEIETTPSIVGKSKGAIPKKQLLVDYSNDSMDMSGTTSQTMLPDAHKDDTLTSIDVEITAPTTVKAMDIISKSKIPDNEDSMVIERTFKGSNETTLRNVSQNTGAIPKLKFLTDQNDDHSFMETTLPIKAQQTKNDTEPTTLKAMDNISKSKIQDIEDSVNMDRTLTFASPSLDFTEQKDLKDMETTSTKLLQNTGAISKLKFLTNQNDDHSFLKTTSSIIPKNKTIAIEDMETSITNVLTKNIKEKDSKLSLEPMDIMKIESPKKVLEKSGETISKNRKTIHFNDNEQIMEIDDITVKHTESVLIKTKSQILQKQKTVSFSAAPDQFKMLMSPIYQNKRTYPAYAFSPATPHRSLLEFEELEKMVKGQYQNENEEEHQNDDMDCEPISSKKKAMKRDTANLTPNLPISKKRISFLPINIDPHCNRFTKLFNEEIELENTLSSEDQMKPVEENFVGKNSTEQIDNSLINISEDAIDQTKPPSLLEYTNESSDATTTNSKNDFNNIHQLRCVSITPSRIPVYTGTIKKDLRRQSSINLQSIQNLDFNKMDDSSEMNFEQTKNKLSVFAKDDIDEPITISDVTQHYASLKNKENDNDNISTIKENNNSCCGNSFDRKKSMAKMQNYFDIMKNPIKMKEIINSMDAECENKTIMRCGNETMEISNINFDEAIAKIDAEFEAAHDATNESIKKQKPTICRKCVNCLDSIINETNSNDSTTNSTIVMPTLPSISELKPKLFARLEKFKKEPALSEVAKIVEHINLKILSLGNIFEPKENDVPDDDINNDDDDEVKYENKYLKQYYALQKKHAEELKEYERNWVYKPTSFVEKLEELMKGPTARNWIFNIEWQHRCILRFYHKKFLSFMIVLQYEAIKPNADEVKIISIKFHEKYLKNNFLPFDFMALFQIKLEFPRDLLAFCEGNSANDVFEMLEKLDEKCIEIDRMTRRLWYLTCKYDGKLIRENHRNFIQKMVRKPIEIDGFYHHTEVTEFRIETLNIPKLCYKNIIMPQAFLFQDDIDQLPMGLEFLESFLPNPASFLRNDNESC